MYLICFNVSHYCGEDKKEKENPFYLYIYKSPYSIKVKKKALITFAWSFYLVIII